MARSKYSASGRVAFAGLCGMYALAGVTVFVPGSSPQGLRGRTPSASNLQYESLSAVTDSEASGAAAQSWAPAQAAALAALVGLTAGMLPVRAEEDGAAPDKEMTGKQKAKIESAQIRDLRANAPSKEERLARNAEGLKSYSELTEDEIQNKPLESYYGNKKAAITVDKTVKKSSRRVQLAEDKKKPQNPDDFLSALGNVKLPSLDVPSTSVPTNAGGSTVKRVIISPADELDEDELPMARENHPLLALILFSPAAIYLTFQILGSTNVI
eukprot:TRINITY_DN1246_c0_g1_i4.p1 TRINITY_DN1246_c0_g1~~TRINITY_DN1246_c0_g1_i4.p1  ORF type:complete len:301 (+),score=80.10 TRINITY_DN1246_c0_g1_i4:94-903(+)